MSMNVFFFFDILFFSSSSNPNHFKILNLHYKIILNGKDIYIYWKLDFSWVNNESISLIFWFLINDLYITKYCMIRFTI